MNLKLLIAVCVLISACSYKDETYLENNNNYRFILENAQKENSITKQNIIVSNIFYMDSMEKRLYFKLNYFTEQTKIILNSKSLKTEVYDNGIFCSIKNTKLKNTNYFKIVDDKLDLKSKDYSLKLINNQVKYSVRY